MESSIKIWRRQRTVKKLLGRKGTILSWTMIYVAGHKYSSQAPYPVLLVELENGERVYGQLVDYREADLAIGSKVFSVLRKIREGNDEDVIAYGMKFRPAPDNQ